MHAPHPAQHPSAPRTVSFDLRVVLPAGTPMVEVADALTQLAASVNGSWSFRAPLDGSRRGRFEVEGRP